MIRNPIRATIPAATITGSQYARSHRRPRRLRARVYATSRAASPRRNIDAGACTEQLTVLENRTAASDAMYDNAYYVEYAIYDVVTKMLRVEGDLEDTSTNRSRHGDASCAPAATRVYHLAGPRGAGGGAGRHHQLDELSRACAIPTTRTTQRLAGRRRISDRGAAPGGRRGDELAHGRTGGHRRRARGAGAEAAAQPRLPEQHAHRLVHQAAGRLWPGALTWAIRRARRC